MIGVPMADLRQQLPAFLRRLRVGKQLQDASCVSMVFQLINSSQLPRLMSADWRR